MTTANTIDVKLGWIISGKYRIRRKIGIGSFGVDVSFFPTHLLIVTQEKFMLATISIRVKKLQSSWKLIQLGISILTTSIKHTKSLAIVVLAYPMSNGLVFRETIR